MPKLQPGKYEHFKGGIYTVFHVAEHTETNEPFVIYKNPHSDTIWARPYFMFIEKVKDDNGNEVPRFKKIDD